MRLQGAPPWHDVPRIRQGNVRDTNGRKGETPVFIDTYERDPDEGEIHAYHTCFACGHVMPFAGHMFGGIVVSHGNEVDATITVTGAKGPYIEMSVELQCPRCHAVNSFTALHHR